MRYFAKFPPTRTQNFLRGGLDASDGGCSPPSPPLRAVESQLGPWNDASVEAPGGLGGAAPRKFSVTTPLNLPENEGNAPFKTNYSKEIAYTFRVKGIKNIVCMNQGHRFMLVMPYSHQVVAVAGGARGNERLKGRKD